MMKKILTFITMTIMTSLYSQLRIDDVSNPTSVSSLLEFKKNGGRGLLLPTVSVLPSTPAIGTILLDATTPSNARIKVYQAKNTWLDLSGVAGDATSITSTRVATNDEVNSGAVIGAETTTQDGVLVLESKTQAMVLPTVTDMNTIVNPSPGMMVFYMKSDTETYLAVFNGSKWSFWKHK